MRMYLKQLIINGSVIFCLLVLFANETIGSLILYRYVTNVEHRLKKSLHGTMRF